MAKDQHIDKVILTSEYLAPVSSIWMYYHANEVLVEACENYQKKSTRNRARIAGPNGIETLSVPLQKGKTNTPITEVQISYESNWIEKHLQAIKTAYSNSPYYEHYIGDLTNILYSQHRLLFDLNQEMTDLLLSKIDIVVDAQHTLDFKVSYPDTVVDLRMTPINQKSWTIFEPKRYQQVFEERHGFLQNLSALDLLMCKGPESIYSLI